MIPQTENRSGSGTDGVQIRDLIEQLFPLHRSQTGEGNRETFRILSERIPLTIHETPSGTSAFGWTIPQEWRIRDAHISHHGQRLIDYRESNLRVLNGSMPVNASMNFDELKDHLCTHPELPESIPYRTAFFRDHWGFCVRHSEYQRLKELQGPFDVEIDAEFFSGSLTHAEFQSCPNAEESFLIWTHCCHPSLANDNLSSLAIATCLAEELSNTTTRLNFHFVFAPATIGAINWLAQQKQLDRFTGGLVLSLLGDRSPLHFKRPARQGTGVERSIAWMQKNTRHDIRVIDFDPFGYDERQFCSPATNLPVGRLTRSLPGGFPEYHSSYDNLDLIDEGCLQESLEMIRNLLQIVDANERLINTQGHCEPFLQPYDLYRAHGDANPTRIDPQAVMWVLNQSDGTRDLLAIAEKSGIDFRELSRAAQSLKRIGILTPAGDP